MSFFKKLFGKPETGPNPAVEQERTEMESASQLALIMSFKKLPVLDSRRVILGINRVEPPKFVPKVHLREKFNDGKHLLGRIEFDDHVINLLGLQSPLPPSVYENAVRPSHWDESFKQSLKKQGAHIILYYEGNHPDPVERFIALYKVMDALRNEDFLGVINESAMNCHPPGMIDAMFEADMLATTRSEPPVFLWCGMVKFVRPDGKIWFTTRGHHAFQVPDFAYLGEGHGEGEKTFNMMNGLFQWLYGSKTVILPGHTAQFGDGVFLRFSEVYEYEEVLQSDNLTLVVEFISPEEANTEIAPPGDH